MYLRLLVDVEGNYKAARKAERRKHGWRWFTPFDMQRRANLFYDRLKHVSGARSTEAFIVSANILGTEMGYLVYWYLDTVHFPEGVPPFST
jgi:hypothetical protein